MKLIFAHDHMFYRYQDKIYSNGGLGKNVLKRYVNTFGNVRLLTRQKVIQDLDGKLTEASGASISFVDVPNFKSINNYKNIFRAKKIIEEEIKNTEYLIARLPSSIGSLAIKYAKKHNKPYLVEVVGCAFDALWNYGNVVGKILAPFEYLKMKKLVKDSKYTVYITKKFLQNRYPTSGKKAVCSNVNISPVNENILSKRLVRISEEKNTLKFGLIGSLDVDYKGHETVLRALSLIKNRLPNFELQFLGKGNSEKWKRMAKELEIENNVKFIGTLSSGEAVYNWQDNIDIILQPSLAEAQGRSIIEAMSRGCPIIASKVGGIVELIDNEYLIKAKDYKKLAILIEKMVLDKNLQKEESIKNFEEAKNYYTENIEKNRVDFFQCFRDGQ